MRSTETKRQVRQALTGPVASISTPFRRDGAVDYRGLRSHIGFCLDGGSRTVLLTAGDSHYLCLSDDEIAEITKVACEQTAGRAMVVAADRYHSTARAIAFAEYAKGRGADVIMTMPPDWGLSCTPETISDHYAAVAGVLPLMIVTNVFIPRGVTFGLAAIRLALQKSESIVAIKDDMCGDFARRVCLEFHERCAIFAGGQKANHMNMYPYGCDGYLSTFIKFRPEVSQRYWQAIETSDLATASRIIRDIDNPYFDFIDTLPGGFNAGAHGSLEVAGVAGRWRRPPYYSLNDADMEKLTAFLKEQERSGLSPLPRQ